MTTTDDPSRARLALRAAVAAIALHSGVAFAAAEPPTTRPTQAPAAANKPDTSKEDAAVAAALASLKTASEQRNYPATIQQARAFLAAHSKRPEAVAVRATLGLALLEAPRPDYRAAAEVLAASVAEAPAGPERIRALHHLGIARRALGHQAAADASRQQDPAKAAEARAAAAKAYEEALAHFTQAAAAADGSAGASADLVSAARLGRLEMLARLGRIKEAIALAAEMQAPLRSAQGSQQARRDARLAGYYGGLAALQADDLPGAGRFLATLAPFDDPALGLLARFHLARVHQLSGEAPEAAIHLQFIVDNDARTRQAVAKALQDPAGFRGRLDDRARLEAAIAELPDVASRTLFHLGALHHDSGRFADAATRLAAFLQQNPKSPFAPEAQLRLAACRVETKQFPEALKLLAPLAEHPVLADRALRQTGQALVASADPTNANDLKQKLAAAIDAFNKAAEKARQAAANDADANARRLAILADLGDAQAAASQHAHAAATFKAILDASAGSPDHVEATLPKLATALAQAGDLDASDAVCRRFVADFPRSPVLPGILYRSALNAVARADAAAGKDPAAPLPAAAKAACEEALKRLAPLIEKYPEFAHVSHARFAAASAHLRLGRPADAAALLEAIPTSERVNTLAAVPYLLADCLIQTLPTDTEDALAAGQLIQQADAAAKLLAEFVAAQANHPLVPDALVKAGQARLRLASIIEDPEERGKHLQQAREAFQLVIQRHARSPRLADATLGAAAAISGLGDPNGAVALLLRFNAEPLRASPVAPMATVQLAENLRRLNRGAEAVPHLDRVRKDHEAKLAADPACAAWVPRLQLAHALALKDANKPAEANALFEKVAKEFAATPAGAQARFRLAQARRDAALPAVASAVARLNQVAWSSDPKALAEARAAADAAAKPLAEAADALQAQAAAEQVTEAKLAMLLDAAASYRSLRDLEQATARAAAIQASIARLAARRKDVPPLPGIPGPRAAEPALASLPPSPAEARARAALKAVVDEAPESAAAVDAALALADLCVARDEPEPAIAAIKSVLEYDHPRERSERLQVQLGLALLAKGAKGDPNAAPAAAANFEAVTQNVKSPLYARARLGYAQAALLAKDYPQAIARLSRFRDKPELTNVPGASDLAMLELGRAHAAAGQHEPSLAAYQNFLDRFPGNPQRSAAYLGIATALHQLKRYDEAVVKYQYVLQRSGTPTPLIGRAYLGIGQCRLEQKRYEEALPALLAAYYGFDDPELNAAALYDAALAFVHLKKPQDARGLLDRLINASPSPAWNERARSRLAEIK